VDDEEAPAYMKKALKKPHKYAPAMSIYAPSRYLGSMSEKYSAKVDEYLEKNPQALLAPKKSKGKDIEVELPRGVREEMLVPQSTFRTLARMRFLKSLVDPGEAVGLLASQG
jgi:DNA-directed RNA polymerase I subunit RPA1